MGRMSRFYATAGRRVVAAATVLALAAALTITAGTAAAAAPKPRPGKLTTVVLSPATATINPGAKQAYSVQGFDAAGNSLGDLTSQATFTISPAGSCTANVCTATTLGAHTVTGTVKKISGTATLTVAQADLATTQTVSDASPYYYAPITFTTTVTNTSSTTTSTGVAASVNLPGAVVTPTVTPSTGAYAAGRWTIGSLAPGASATLTISGFAGDVAAGLQTVTASVTAATFDPNSANNTASASEASQPAPLLPVLTGPSGALDVCPPTVTVTWTPSMVNLINPAAPTLAPGTFSYVMGCANLGSGGCPSPTSAPGNQSFISFNNTDFVVGADYLISLTIFPVFGANPNYQDKAVSINVGSPPPYDTAPVFSGVCLS
ncbi:hypothetical protein GCM10009630_50610 [Kribbella jejuensis]|uniref:DUF11 domain-containing protein n=1 Tax=Kribbella jejuensis TaxID=236068 RepID=A0A542D9V1_9ACTN|nr:DUF11 domain-containing protein [Kribbella jejuensis]TQI99862.1 hypothetical protein FB475_6850 [Kribbella jejuensis]